MKPLPEGYEVDPDQTLDTMAGYSAYARRMQKARGEVLRFFLEKGVEWRELEPVVRGLSRHKQQVRELAHRWWEPFVVKLRKTSP